MVSEVSDAGRGSLAAVRMAAEPSSGGYQDLVAVGGEISRVVVDFSVGDYRAVVDMSGAVGFLASVRKIAAPSERR